MTQTTITIIAVNSGYQIEVLNGEYWPMLRRTTDESFCYFRKGRNGYEVRRSEQGARKFIADYMARMGETQEQLTQPTPHAAEELAVIDEELEAIDASVQAYIAAELAEADMSPHRQSEWFTILEETAAVRDWNKLLQTPGYVERNMTDVRMFIETHVQDELAHIEDDIASGDIPLVPMEDRMLHSDDRPFCGSSDCPCHADDELFDEYILEPVMAGLMTTYEASRILWNEHI